MAGAELSKLVASKAATADDARPPREGAVLIALKCHDYRYLKADDKAAIRPSELEYPVRCVFSAKRRPLRFKGKIEFRDVYFRYPTVRPRYAIDACVSAAHQPQQPVPLLTASTA